MTHYNPMLEKLQQQIQEYNKDTEAKIEKVAFNQNLITLGFVVFNIIVFIMEVLVIIAEFIIYKKFLEYKKKSPLFISSINNIISFSLGIIISKIIF